MEDFVDMKSRGAPAISLSTPRGSSARGANREPSN
jgi:hypothetical protein